MKIKVSRDVLLEKISEYKTKLEEQSRSDEAQAKRVRAAWKEAARKAIAKVSSDVSRGLVEGDGWTCQFYEGDPESEITVTVTAALPVEAEDIDYRVVRDYEAVKACADPVISISPDDHLYRYLAQPEKSR